MLVCNCCDLGVIIILLCFSFFEEENLKFYNYLLAQGEQKVV
jgi:hypothetical protein